ncbi:MAG: phosphatidylinositol kinase [Acidobacteria bacterium]|nr:MAG: phosphatidylinositol kinase [Acidobacteriota bacterium]
MLEGPGNFGTGVHSEGDAFTSPLALQGGHNGSFEVQKVVAVECIRRMRGGSQPFLMGCDDGQTYVVKFRNNPQHARILANEMLASRLAILIRLPVPGRAFVQVSQSLISGTPLLRFQTAGREEQCVAGVHFGSRFPGPPSQTLVVDFLPDRLLRRVSKLASIFMGAYVLDKWTCNCDGRQMIFYRTIDQGGSHYSATLIDQGFCFNDGEWNFPDSPIRSLYPRRLVYEDVRGLQSFEPYLSQVENIEANELDECVRDVPREWCGDDPDQISRLVEQLYARRRRVRQLIIDAKQSSLRPFPNWE